MTISRYLVSTEWLAARLGDANLAIVDGSWHMPAANRDARGEFLASHIPGAVFFDVDEISDKSSGLPHMLPNAETFAEIAGRMGISEKQDIVVYDSAGLFSAPRVWWTFQIFGARNVFILDGGFPAWIAENRPVETGNPVKAAAVFQARLDKEQVKNIAGVQAALNTGIVQLIDARPVERFRGDAPEPRPGVRAGHIPGSKNLPFTCVIDNGRLASHDKIRAAAAAAGISAGKPVITSCGSGVTAAILALAFTTADIHVEGIYDGSWTEWGSRHDLPLATGSE